MVPQLPLTLQLKWQHVPLEDGQLSKDHAFWDKLEYVPFNLLFSCWSGFLWSNRDASDSSVWSRMSCHKDHNDYAYRLGIFCKRQPYISLSSFNLHIHQSRGKDPLYSLVRLLGALSLNNPFIVGTLHIF